MCLKKTFTILIIFIFFSSVFSACIGIDVNNEAMEDCAKTFLKALINEDEKTLNAINKSDQLFPTNNLLSEVSPNLKR